MEIVKTEGISKSYKNKKVLDDVSISISKGDIYGLIGRNGAGKTTLMRILCGLSSADSGTFSLFGVNGTVSALRTNIGAIIETPALYPNFTVRKNLQAVAILRGISSKSKIIDEMIDLAGLNANVEKKVKNLSLGMKQRLAISMVMMNEPEFLILDEPVNGLDPVGIVQVREMLLNLNKKTGVTILISSHLLTELSQLATKFGIIEKGCLKEEVTATELFKKLTKTLVIEVGENEQEKVRKIIMDEFKVICEIHGTQVKVISDKIDEIAAKINKLLVDKGLSVSGLNLVSMNLENYFMQITGTGGQV